MSNSVSNLVYGSVPFGQPSRRIVMVALADRADDSGYCFPGISDLASRTELSARTILRCVSDLEAGGWVKVTRNVIGPLLRGNSYVLDIAKLRQCQKAKRGTVTPIEVGICDSVASIKMTRETPSGDIDGPLYRKNHHEPSVEPKTISRSASFLTNDDLERVYEAYPRKVGKVAALEAIRKAVAWLTSKHHDKMKVAEALRFLERKTRSFARSPAGNQENFTPHPATWFNQGRYADDESEWTNAEQPKEARNGQRQGNESYESPAAGRNARSRDGIEKAFAELRAIRSGIESDDADQGQLSISGITNGDL